MMWSETVGLRPKKIGLGLARCGLGHGLGLAHSGLDLVSSGLGLGLVILVLVLRIWSCLHHWFKLTRWIKTRYTVLGETSTVRTRKNDSGKKCIFNECMFSMTDLI